MNRNELIELPAAEAATVVEDREATVVIADDHPLYRDGLARAIASRSDLRLVGKAGDGEAAATLIAGRQPDVAVLDMRMPRLDGIELCAQLTALGPRCRTRVILLSAFLDSSLVREAVGAGAAGYLDKDATRAKICAGITRVARGGTAFSDAATPGVVEAFQRSLMGGAHPGW